MKEYIFQKGELNSLNNLNQDMKSIFSEYAIFPDQICVGDGVLNKGIHWCTTSYVFPMVANENTFIVLRSMDIFQTIKSFKKDIKGFRVYDDKSIRLYSDIEEYPIGYISELNDLAYHKYYVRWVEIKSLEISYTSVSIPITEDDIFDLTKNEIKPIVHGKFRTRITKEVIPGLKKNHNLTVSFNEIDSIMFYLQITSNRNTVVSCHLYKCVYI